MDKPVLGQHPLTAKLEPTQVLVGIPNAKEAKLEGPYDFERPVIVPAAAVHLQIQHEDHVHTVFPPTLAVMN